MMIMTNNDNNHLHRHRNPNYRSFSSFNIIFLLLCFTFSILQKFWCNGTGAADIMPAPSGRHRIFLLFGNSWRKSKQRSYALLLNAYLSSSAWQLLIEYKIISFIFAHCYADDDFSKRYVCTILST